MKAIKYVLALVCIIGIGVANEAGVSEPTELKDTLALSDEQVQQLQDLKAQLAEAVQADKEQIRTLQMQLREELTAETPNAAIVGQLQVEIEELTTKIAATRAEFSEDARALLSPEQLAVLTTLEQALALATPAHQAVALNLITTDTGAPIGFRHGPRGRGRR